jgi:hypothetical protein
MLVRRHRQGVAWHASPCTSHALYTILSMLCASSVCVNQDFLHLAGISIAKANIRIFYFVLVIIEFRVRLKYRVGYRE